MELELCSHGSVKLQILDNSTCVVRVFKVAVIQACLYNVEALQFKETIKPHGNLIFMTCHLTW